MFFAWERDSGAELNRDLFMGFFFSLLSSEKHSLCAELNNDLFSYEKNHGCGAFFV